MINFEEYPTITNPYQSMGNYDPLSSLSLTKYDPIHAALVKRKKILDGDDVELPQKTEYKNEDVIDLLY